MKQKFLKAVPCAFLLSAPLFLNGCQEVDNFFGNPGAAAAPPYENQQQVQTKGHAGRHQRIEGEAHERVTNAHQNSVAARGHHRATTSSSQAHGPAVPNAAPTVGQ